MITPQLLEMWKRHEGFRTKPYLCGAQKLTIGYGRNLEDVGISVSEAGMLAINDLQAARMELHNTFAWFKELNPARQDALTDMVGNIGLSRFLGFKKTIQALSTKDFEKASKEMLDSKWATQVSSRAHELSEMIRLGVYLDSKGGLHG